MRIAFRVLLFILITFFTIILGYTIIQGYTTTTYNLYQTLHELGIKLDVYNIITEMVFRALQLGLLVCLSILVYFSVFKFDYVYRYIKQFFKHIIEAIINVWRDLKTKEAMSIMIIPFIASVYFGLTVPVSYDEVWTYISFTNKPFYFCMVYYPFPNNHILHSLLTNITEHLPFFDMLFRIRIPVIIISLVTWAIAFSFVKKYYSTKVAMFVIAIASVMFRSIYYSFLSRGYEMMILFFVIGIYAAYNIIYKGSRKKDWIFLSISGILGCYAIPSFLYPFATINLLILIFNYKNIKQQIFYNVLTGFSILILYTPIFLVSGFKSIANNQFVTPETQTRLDVLLKLPSFFNEGLADLSGICSWFILVVMGIALILSIKEKDKNKLWLWLILCITPFILLFLHSVIPFHRTFIYYTFAIPFLVGISLIKYLNKLSTLLLTIGLCLIQIAGVIHFKLNIAEAETFNTTANDITDKILERDKTYLVNYSHILFNMEAEGYDMSKIYVEEGTHITWNNADSINNIDYIVITKSIDKTKIKKPFYSNKDMNVYKKGE